MKRLSPCALVALSLALASSGSAATITGLKNTGLDASGNVLPDDSVEQTWSVTPQGGTTQAPFVTTSAGGFPVGPWLADNSSSAWLTLTQDTNAPPVDYAFSIPFSLQGLRVDSVLITGQWSSDNGGTDVLLNGISTGQVNNEQFAAWSSFSLSSAEGHAFNQGDNLLTFVVNNAPPDNNPMGFRAEFTEASATPIPEPSAAALGLLGALVFFRRRRLA